MTAKAKRRITCTANECTAKSFRHSGFVHLEFLTLPEEGKKIALFEKRRVLYAYEAPVPKTRYRKRRAAVRECVDSLPSLKTSS